MAKIDGPKLARAYVSLRQELNDLRVVAGSQVDPSGFTLFGLLRNEMYFLPDFLTHYRQLGVQRFVFLNDRSVDGSLDYLLIQPDVVVVESSRTYGDTVDIPPHALPAVADNRIMPFWRSMLHDTFGNDRWSIQVDLDEFVLLPVGMVFQDLLVRLEEQGERAVWGAMLDVYPRDISTLVEYGKSTRLDISATWYFDGEQHLRLRRARRPRTVHPGARARLYCEYGVDRLYETFGVAKRISIRRVISQFWTSRKPARYNVIYKPTLLKWSDNCYFRNSHSTNLRASASHLLPIMHFRFAGPLYEKIRTGIEEQSFYNRSTDHRLLRELLAVMAERNGSFLYKKSRPLDSFEVAAETHNAFGL